MHIISTSVVCSIIVGEVLSMKQAHPGLRRNNTSFCSCTVSLCFYHCHCWILHSVLYTSLRCYCWYLYFLESVTLIIIEYYCNLLVMKRSKVLNRIVKFCSILHFVVVCILSFHFCGTVLTAAVHNHVVWYAYSVFVLLSLYQVFTLKVRYDLNCVKSAVKLQPTNEHFSRITTVVQVGQAFPKEKHSEYFKQAFRGWMPFLSPSQHSEQNSKQPERSPTYLVCSYIIYCRNTSCMFRSVARQSW